MMSEEILNELFEQARNEPVETDMNSVHKWVGSAIVTRTIAENSKKTTKVFTTKTIIMTLAGLITVVGLIGTYFITGSTDCRDKKTVSGMYTVTPEQVVETKNSFPVSNTPGETNGNKSRFNSNGGVTSQEIGHLNLNESFFTPFDYLPIQQLERSVFSPVPEPLVIRNENSSVGNFNVLYLHGTVDVIVSQGTECSVKVEDDEKGQVIINSKGNTLEIYTTQNEKLKRFQLFQHQKSPKVYVTVKDLFKISCAGVVDVISKGELKCDQLELTVSGVADVDFSLDVTNLTVDISGVSDVTLKGTADKVKLTNSGVSDFNAKNLLVKSISMDCTDISNTKVNVTESLDVRASGSCLVKYTGSPVLKEIIIERTSRMRQL